MYRIIFMRHGRSLADDENKHEGRYNSNLTTIGEKQARKTTENLSEFNYSFDAIITSPLTRAHKTALIVNKMICTTIIEEPLWMEADNGDLAGKPINDNTDKEFPVPENGFSIYDMRANGSGESRAQLYSRAVLAIDKLLRMPEGNYLIVSHGGILNAAMQYIMRTTPTSSWEGNIGFAFGDNGFAEFIYDRNKNNWTLFRFDRGFQ